MNEKNHAYEKSCMDFLQSSAAGKYQHAGETLEQSRQATDTPPVSIHVSQFPLLYSDHACRILLHFDSVPFIRALVRGLLSLGSQS